MIHSEVVWREGPYEGCCCSLCSEPPPMGFPSDLTKKDWIYFIMTSSSTYIFFAHELIGSPIHTRLRFFAMDDLARSGKVGPTKGGSSAFICHTHAFCAYRFSFSHTSNLGPSLKETRSRGPSLKLFKKTSGAAAGRFLKVS